MADGREFISPMGSFSIFLSCAITLPLFIKSLNLFNLRIAQSCRRNEWRGTWACFRLIPQTALPSRTKHSLSHFVDLKLWLVPVSRASHSPGNIYHHRYRLQPTQHHSWSEPDTILFSSSLSSWSIQLSRCSSRPAHKSWKLCILETTYQSLKSWNESILSQSGTLFHQLQLV